MSYLFIPLMGLGIRMGVALASVENFIIILRS